MTTVFGDTSRGVAGTLHSFPSLFTPSTPVETYLGQGSAVVLPNANPGAGGAQVSYTCQAADCPVYATGVSGRYQPSFYAAGKNTSASAVTISIQLYNGASAWGVGQSGSCPAGYYWTLQTWNTTLSTNPTGDVYNLAMWASASSAANYDYYAFNVMPVMYAETRLLNKNMALYNFTFTTNTTYPTLSLGVPSRGGSRLGNCIYVASSTHSQTYCLPGTTKMWYSAATYGYQYQDAAVTASNSYVIQTSSGTTHPLYYSMILINSASYIPIEVVM
jgi:hypothetical protein